MGKEKKGRRKKGKKEGKEKKWRKKIKNQKREKLIQIGFGPLIID